MVDHELTVEEVKGSDLSIAPGRHESLWGGIDPPPSWHEYLEGFEAEFHPYLLVARQWLLDTYGEDPPRGADWCNDHMLRFSDGLLLSFTFRAWGDFVQSVRNKREGYLEFYS